MKIHDCGKIEIPFWSSDKVVYVNKVPGDEFQSIPPLEVGKVYVVRWCLPFADFSSYGLELVGITSESLVPVDRFIRL